MGILADSANCTPIKKKESSEETPSNLLASSWEKLLMSGGTRERHSLSTPLN